MNVNGVLMVLEGSIRAGSRESQSQERFLLEFVGLG